MSADRQIPPRPPMPRIRGEVIFERDGVEYRVDVREDCILVRGPLHSEYIDHRWPERVWHPWMWGKSVGDVVELAVVRAHRKHMRAAARLRDLDELKRQLQSREERHRR